MSRRRNSILNALFRIPWWVSVLLALSTYVSLKYIIPAVQTENTFLISLGKAGPYFAPFIALIFLLPAPFSLFREESEENIMDSINDIESIRALSQQGFEHLIEQAYSTQGYTVIKNTFEGLNRRAIFRLEKDGKHFITQCSQLSRMDVGIEVVRELYKIVTAEQAHGGIIITSGIFTQEAASFAADKPIDLINGDQLVALVDIARMDSKATDMPNEM